MTVSLNLELILTIATLIGIAFGAVGFLFKLYRGYESNTNEYKEAQVKFTFALDQLVREVSELKGYGPRIEQNEKDILALQKDQENIKIVCNLRHKENEHE